MAEYIEREAVINQLRECDGTPHEIAYTYPVYEDLEQFVESLPAADVAPVVRGRWDLLDDAGSKIVKWNCDKCNRISTSKTDYCPNCGARMEESESK